MAIVSVASKVELMVANELGQGASHEGLAARFATGVVLFRKRNEGPFHEVVNGRIEGQNRPRFVLVISQEAEFLS